VTTEVHSINGNHLAKLGLGILSAVWGANSSQLILAAFVNDAQIQLKFLSESNLDFVPARK
jgi:hypothetical protein